MMPKTQSVVRAEQILAGQQPARGELDSLAKKLKDESKFKWARHLFEIRLEEDDVKENLRLQLKLGGQLALCTYKDPDLPVDERLDGALAILKRIASIDPKDQETLGLFGAVHKRRWETFARKEDLERSARIDRELGLSSPAGLRDHAPPHADRPTSAVPIDESA
jgi:hypothetical protein